MRILKGEERNWAFGEIKSAPSVESAVMGGINGFMRRGKGLPRYAKVSMSLTEKLTAGRMMEIGNQYAEIIFAATQTL